MRPIVVLKGGLGNQLFQWYFAHSISDSFTYSFLENNSSEVKIKASLNLNPTPRDFELGPLQKVCSHGSKAPTNFVKRHYIQKSPKLTGKIWDISALRPIMHRFGYLRDDPRKNVQSSEELPEIIRIADGYFQEEKYITQVWRDVSVELSKLLTEIYVDLRNRLSLPEQYQVIHVRRPDEKHHLISPLNLGALDNLYFKNSCRKIPTENRILLISQKNDLGVTANFIRPKFVFDSVETTAWETLAIMSFAQNLIGSNSTLSWWGARMCASNGGNAYLPDKWSIRDNFETSKLFFSDLNLLPSSWMSSNESQY